MPVRIAFLTGFFVPYGKRAEAVPEPRLFFLFTADTVRSALSQSRYG